MKVIGPPLSHELPYITALKPIRHSPLPGGYPGSSEIAAAGLNPSHGEFEITSLNKVYLERHCRALAKSVIMSDIDSSRAPVMKWETLMKNQLAGPVFTPLSRTMLTLFALITNSAHANQIAQGLVQVSITAETWPNITITSATCGVGLFTFDTVSQLSFSSDTRIEATIQGSVISCTVVVPYYWSVSSLNGNISVSYSISAQNGTVVVKTASGGFLPIPLTATGTTTESVNTIF